MGSLEEAFLQLDLNQRNRSNDNQENIEINQNKVENQEIPSFLFESIPLKSIILI